MCVVAVAILSYKRMHVFFFFWTFCGCRTARIASSNTVFKPFCVSAEHSRYFTALISFCICSPCGYVMGASRFSLSFSIVSLSSRRSSFVPTRIIGVFGQWWLTSGYHYVEVRTERTVWSYRLYFNECSFAWLFKCWVSILGLHKNKPLEWECATPIETSCAVKIIAKYKRPCHMLSNNGLCLVSTQHALYVLPFLVLVVNSDQFVISCSYSSHLFLCALSICELDISKWLQCHP